MVLGQEFYKACSLADLISAVGDNPSSDGATAVNDYFQSKGLPKITTPDGDLKAATIAVFGGEGFNVPTKEGSHSFIILGISGKNTEQAVTSGHEVFGHGIPSSRGQSPESNNSNAIVSSPYFRPTGD